MPLGGLEENTIRNAENAKTPAPTGGFFFKTKFVFIGLKRKDSLVVLSESRKYPIT
jgi:hypothetical protein